MGFENIEDLESRGHSCGDKGDVSGTGCGCNLSCVCNVVRAIKDIQDEAVNDDCLSCPANCFIEPLGDLTLPDRDRVDTRVFTLTNKNGDLMSALFKGHAGKCSSVFFRVEDVFDNCCATLRVLIPLNKDRHVVKLFNHGKLDYDELCSVKDWARSNSCITVDLHCFCAIQCIADVDLDICD